MARSRVAGPCFPLAGAARNSRCDSRPLIWLSLPRRDWPLSSRTRPPPVGRDQRLLATCSLILRAGTSFLTRLAGSWRRMFKCRPQTVGVVSQHGPAARSSPVIPGLSGRIGNGKRLATPPGVTEASTEAENGNLSCGRSRSRRSRTRPRRTVGGRIVRDAPNKSGTPPSRQSKALRAARILFARPLRLPSNLLSCLFYIRLGQVIRGGSG